MKENYLLMSLLINDTETIITYAANNDNDIVSIYISNIGSLLIYFWGLWFLGLGFSINHF